MTTVNIKDFHEAVIEGVLWRFLQTLVSLGASAWT
jgi:hypothetical protein